MCGIVGKIYSDTNRPVDQAEVSTLLAPIAHRGPDSQGIFTDRNCGLGHRRLAIVDLDGGPQPMPNEDKSVWIVFNGEIYNHEDLRERLIAKGHVFRSRSDTEAIVHAYEEFGEDCVQHLQGMFAFAIWDVKRRRLFAARDRVGIKPFYYAEANGVFYFASELKAILASSEVAREMDVTALSDFFSFFYVPGDETLIRKVRRLPPGHTLELQDGQVKVRQYWTLNFSDERRDWQFGHVTEELRALLKKTVRSHLMADVPLGVLLSGGLDSSAIVSLAAEQSTKQIRTFTVGFDADGDQTDERPYARQIAKRFCTEHHELSITAEDFWSFLPDYVWHMEDPVCEPPAVALYFISNLARRHVKVLLSGEGGDEAFGGYPNYVHMMRLDSLGRRLSPFSRPAGALAEVVGAVFGKESLRRYGGALGRPLSEHYFSRSSYPTSYFNRSADLFAMPGAGTAVPAASRRVAALLRDVRGRPLLDQMLYVDTSTWLPDDLLVKADKMTMATSVELRVPLLDHKVLEFAASLASDHKVRGTETKRILKAAFSQILPPDIMERKKAGFPIPYGSWLRGPLAGRVRDTLLAPDAASRNYFNRRQLESLLQVNEQSGLLSKEVFSLLVVELWMRRFAVSAPAPTGRDRPASVLTPRSDLAVA